MRGEYRRVCVVKMLCVLQVEAIEDTVREKLQLVLKGQSQLEEKERNELKKRKLLTEV